MMMSLVPLPIVELVLPLELILTCRSRYLWRNVRGVGRVLPTRWMTRINKVISTLSTRRGARIDAEASLHSNYALESWLTAGRDEWLTAESLRCTFLAHHLILVA